MKPVTPAAPRPTWRRRLAVRAAGLAAFLVGIWTVPHLWCMREANRWFDGDAGLQGRLAAGVEHWISRDLDVGQFRTSNGQFSGEWLFGTYMMAAMGYGQTALEHPEWRERHSELMARCIDLMLSDKVRAFDTASWQGEDAIEALDSAAGGSHAAYLGYMNLAMSLHRLVDPQSRHAALNDRVTEALARRVAASPSMLIETYPNEAYPVDNCAVIASIGLNARATGRDRSALLADWERSCRDRFVDPECGLLFQSVDHRTGGWLDYARGSGTTLGGYFLSFSHPRLAAELHAAVRERLAGTLLGFGAVREYPPGSAGSGGDIDSGPIVFGYGVSSTGFCLAGSRIHGDRAYYARLYASAYLAGAPIDRDGRRTFVTGGPLGDAILFAVLTAQPARAEGGSRP